MIILTVFDAAQIIMIAISFILHILTFDTLTMHWKMNMIMFETFVYGTYFVIKCGYLVAILTDGNFTPPLEAMTKIQGAVLYNIVGLLTLLSWISSSQSKSKGVSHDTKDYLMVLKGISGLIVSGLYYAELVVALVFIFHLLTFYQMSYSWGINMNILETPVYGMYFIMKLGYLIAILTDGTLTPALEAMTKIHGAVLYNVLGVVTLVTWFHNWQQKKTLPQYGELGDYLFAFKGLGGLIVGGLYYVDVYEIPK